MHVFLGRRPSDAYLQVSGSTPGLPRLFEPSRKSSPRDQEEKYLVIGERRSTGRDNHRIPECEQSNSWSPWNQMPFVGAGYAMAFRHRKVGAGTGMEQHRRTQSCSRVALIMVTLIVSFMTAQCAFHIGTRHSQLFKVPPPPLLHW